MTKIDHCPRCGHICPATDLLGVDTVEFDCAACGVVHLDCSDPEATPVVINRRRRAAVIGICKVLASIGVGLAFSGAIAFFGLNPGESALLAYAAGAATVLLISGGEK